MMTAEKLDEADALQGQYGKSESINQAICAANFYSGKSKKARGKDAQSTEIKLAFFLLKH